MTCWHHLADLKESYPIEVAEFAVAPQGFTMNLLSYGGYHTYWPSANKLLLLSTNDIINKCTNMELRFLRTMMIVCKSTMKTVANTLWQDAIHLEMAKVQITFQILNDNESIPPTYQQIHCHMVYDMKMEDFRCKA
jgi:hypothetical protein